MTTPAVPRVVRRIAVALAAGALAAGPALAIAPAAHAADARSLSWYAHLGGRDVASATSNRPIVLDPAAGSKLEIGVENTGTVPLTVRAVVLEGRVIGLPFFSYRTRLDMTVPAKTTAAPRQITLDLSDLGDQATGLIPARVRLLGDQREVLASQSFVTDVKGRSLSVYGIFGLVIAAVTVLLLLGLVLGLVRGRLPVNRWQRAMQFLPAGVGIGFVATFTLSATRVLSPSPTLWVPLVLICAAVAFVLGYLAPGPDLDDDDATDALPRQRGRRAAATAAATTAAVGAGGAAALYADQQPDAVGTYDSAPYDSAPYDSGTYGSAPYDDPSAHGDAPH